MTKTDEFCNCPSQSEYGRNRQPNEAKYKASMKWIEEAQCNNFRCDFCNKPIYTLDEDLP